MAPSWLPVPSLLPVNLQKRLLSYALTNVLGTLLEPQTFMLENIELQLLNGSLSLRNIQLNTAKLNTLLTLPVEIITGAVGQVTVQIPVRDVLSGRIYVHLSGIEVVVRPCSETDKPSEPVPELSPDSLAQSFLESSVNDPSDSVLLDSLTQSIPSSQELGLGPAQEEGVFTSILAGFVSALKARLVVEIDDLAIQIQYPQSGAFILSLAHISFAPREEKLLEKVLRISGIEAYLQSEFQDQDDDAVSVTSTSTITSPSPTSHRSPSSGDGDHGLSESMMFSPQEVESLYMSAYSQSTSRSVYKSAISDLPPIEEPSTPPLATEEPAESKGFRFFYFEQDLLFHVTAGSPQPPTSPVSAPTLPPPVLQSELPTAHLFLNPEVNLLPSISLISAILSLSPTASSQSAYPSNDNTGGLEFSWPGGVVIHFGSENEETTARFSHWKVSKQIGQEDISLSIGKVEIVSFNGTKLVTLDDRMTVLLLPNLLQFSLPKVTLNVEVEGIRTLQPLFKAMKLAWQDSLPHTEHTEEEEGEGWNENLIIEKTAQEQRQFQLDIQSLAVNILTQDDSITFTIDQISTRVQSSTTHSLEFAAAAISFPSNPDPILAISRGNGISPSISIVFPEITPRLRFLDNGAQEILDDFLVGDTSRSDDAWGMIHADAANNSGMFIKVKVPRIDVRITEKKDIKAVKNVMEQVQRTMAVFLEDQVATVEDAERIDLVLEFALGEGLFGVKLDANEMFEGRCEGLEGTVVKGIAGGEIVGVVDVGKLQIDVEGLETSQKYLHESIRKGNDSTPSLGLRFVYTRDGQVTSRVALYNLNFEYHVYNPWIEKLGKVFASTPETNSVARAALATTESIVVTSTIPPPAQLHLSLSDCTIGLNPLDLPSRGLVLVTSTTIRGQWDFREGGRGKFDVSLNKVHLFCIDDTSNLSEPRPRVRSGRKEILGYFSDLGYALCATMPTGNATIRFVLPDARSEIDVEDVSIQLDTCADSTQTLGDMFNYLKAPIEVDEGRYQSGNHETINILEDIDENAFNGGFSVVKDSMPLDEDLVTDDIPFNLAFVESYYGDQAKLKASMSRDDASIDEELGDELLAEGDDIGHFAEPPKPAEPVAKGTFGEFEEQIRVFSQPSTQRVGGSVLFVDDHFPTHSILQENTFLSTNAAIKLKMRNTRVVWNLHDGYDWPRTRDAIALAVQKLEQKAADALSAKARLKTPQPTRTVTLPEVLYGEDPYAFDEEEDDDFDDDSEIGDILFNSIYVGVRKGQDPKSLARNINRDLDAQSETTSQVSTSTSSPIRSSRGASPGLNTSPFDRNRRSGRSLNLKRSRMQKVQINLRSLGVDFQLLQEPLELGQNVLSTLRLRVGDLEILDNVPTSSWNKFVTYWDAGGKRRRETASAMVDLNVSTVKPVQNLTASELVIKARVLPLKLHVDQDTLDFITRFFEFKDETTVPAAGIVPEPPFLQRIEVFPVHVLLDYKPKKVDYAGLRSGRTTEFMNFFTLEEANILLRHITLYGISGYPKLFQKLNDFWMPDIRGTQLLDVLGGINYIRPFANIGGGVKDLILVPMREYQKDGRVLQGTSKGVIKFGKTFANELVKVGAKVAVGAQKGLEWGEGLIEGRPSPSGRGRREGVRFDDEEDSDFENDPRVVTLSPYADQPANIRQGIKRAIETLVRNAKSAGETVIAIPQEVAESGTAAGAGKTVLKAIPVAIIRPLIGASGAVSNTLMGIHNTLDSNHQRNLEDKYKR